MQEGAATAAPPSATRSSDICSFNSQIMARTKQRAARDILGMKPGECRRMTKRSTQGPVSTSVQLEDDIIATLSSVWEILAKANRREIDYQTLNNHLLCDLVDLERFIDLYPTNEKVEYAAEHIIHVKQGPRLLKAIIHRATGPAAYASGADPQLLSEVFQRACRINKKLAPPADQEQQEGADPASEETKQQSREAAKPVAQEAQQTEA